MFRRHKKEPAKPEPRYYIEWDEVKTVEDLKAIFLMFPGSGGSISEYTAERLAGANPNLIRKEVD